MAEDIFVDEHWYFITTPHRKVAVHGIGVLTKIAVWNQVKQRQVIINTASDFIRCAEKAVPGVTFILLTPDDVRENMKMLDDCWIRVKQSPKIQSSNFFVAKENDSLVYGKSFLSASLTTTKVFHLVYTMFALIQVTLRTVMYLSKKIFKRM